MVIGGISEIAATNGASTARPRGIRPAGDAEHDSDQRRNGDAAEQPGEAGGGVGPEQVVAGALTPATKAKLSDRRRHLPERRQSLSSGFADRRMWLPMA